MDDVVSGWEEGEDPCPPLIDESGCFVSDGIRCYPTDLIQSLDSGENRNRTKPEDRCFTVPNRTLQQGDLCTNQFETNTASVLNTESLCRHNHRTEVTEALRARWLFEIVEHAEAMKNFLHLMEMESNRSGVLIAVLLLLLLLLTWICIFHY